MKLQWRVIYEYLVYLFIFVLPWQARLILVDSPLGEYGQISLYAVDVIFALLVFAAIMAHRQDRELFARERRPRSDLILLFFLVVLLLSALLGFAPTIGLYHWTIWVEGVVLFWLISRGAVPVSRLIGVVVVAIIIQAMVGEAQFIFQRVWGSKWLGMAVQYPGQSGVAVIEWLGNRWLRSYGALPHPNILGGVVGVGLLLMLVWKDTARKLYGFLSVRWVTITALIVWSWLLAFSRSAWLAVIIGLIIYKIIVFFRRKSNPDSWRKFVVASLCITFLALSVILPLRGLFVTRLFASGRLEQLSIDERVSTGEQALAVIRATKGWGIGLGSYVPYINQTLIPNCSACLTEPAHNIYILFLAETGFGGLVILLFIIVLAFMRAWRARKNLTEEALVWSIVIIALLIIGLFDHYLVSLHFGVLWFWLCLGIWQKAVGESSRQLVQ